MKPEHIELICDVFGAKYIEGVFYNSAHYLADQSEFGELIAAIEVEKDAGISKLKEELELERMRHACCGVAALGYLDREKTLPEFISSSAEDVIRLYDKHLALSQENESLKQQLADLEYDLNASIDNDIKHQMLLAEAREEIERLKVAK